MFLVSHYCTFFSNVMSCLGDLRFSLFPIALEDWLSSTCHQ